MKNSKTATAIAIVLVSVFAISVIALPATYAQLDIPYVSTGRFTTKAFIGALPNPVGVGQEVLLHIGIQQQLATVDRGWYGMSVTIERPDGKIDTITDIKTDSTGGTGRVYVPPVAGTYYLQSHFPEQRMPTTAGGIPANTTMLASDSPKLTLVVTEEPLQYYPAAPLPNEFWTRPINAQLREWSAISGSSWMDNEYNEAPESPHVLWTKPLTMGGLVGGDIGDHSFEHGDAYEGKWPNRLILAGRMYYTAGPYERPVVTYCVDLRTGEQIWAKVLLDNRTISTGQTFYWDNFNYHGTFDYLWVVVSSNWTAIDAFTGEPSFTFYSVPSGTNIYGPSGEICRYSISLNSGLMTLWNSTKAGLRGASGMSAGSWGSRVANQQINATTYGLEYNISIPTGLRGSVRSVSLGDKVVGGTQNTTHVVNWAFSLKAGQEGQLLYDKVWNAPASWMANNVTFATYGSSWALTDLDANIGLIWAKEELLHYAFDLNTGNFLWVSEVPHHYLDTYSIGRRIEYGKMYSVGMAGIIYCWDTANGKLLWTYNATDPYSEFLWGNYWAEDLLFIQGGKLYFFHSEHSPVNPLFRGAPAVCLDAETGEEVWRVDGLFRKTDWGGSPIMGDSVIAMYNSYDQQVYAIGKGPSAMTVEAPMAAITLGSSLVIRGTVIDVSPGTKQTSVALRFPKGVPAVSDESQGEWMKHVYAQFARPMDVTGVDVTLSVLDSNGNYRDIGTTTADADGFFKFKFTPDIEGEYTVYASFEGSGSYYPSHATSAFTVDPAPATPLEPQPEPVSMTDTYVMGMGIAVIVAIAIVGAVLVLILRKR
ncbi:TPA: PQQ-binding-like beta-propeller repeat protein [Candidatus Bathyarchaeota archaeon]|nr:PQQ-binding-like beta-propeller repeat protein [Candidatus Bathyarchaeota archaeon]